MPPTTSILTLFHPVFRRLGVLEVREILDVIMSFLDDDGDLLAASLVCKTWSPVALDHLWNTLDSVIPLFKLLGPMVYYIHSWSYVTDTISEADWARFEFYSRRVRNIHKEGVESSWGDLGEGALDQVIHNRPSAITHILPRVTEIDWTETFEAGWPLQLIHLLSPTLKSFGLNILSDRTTSVTDGRDVLRHLAFLPGLKLKRLQARWIDSVPTLDVAVCDVLDRQRGSLASFSHQSFNLNQQLGTSLSQLPNLVNLELKFTNVNTRGDEDFNEFGALLASKCPGLRTIRFCIPFGPREFTFCAFQPLTRIGGLREIRLGCRELDLKEKDFKEMGESWRSLVALAFPDSGIPLLWFAAIAVHFPPTLEDINVNIRVSEDLDPDCTKLTAFTSLKRVSYIAVASPKALKAVGSLLRQLVSPNTVVECAKWMEQRLKEVTGNSVKWKGKWAK
ncbi:hypothetical protein FRC01_001000 [Tulasnella sp. 417]|nr:hypothetical protein FRC01_001000 [Tulasnella sp. 417]